MDLLLRTTADLGPTLRGALRPLWDAAFDDFTDEDAAHALGGTHALLVDGGEVLAHASVVTRTLLVDGEPLRTGYVEGVATRPGRRGEGLGTRVVGAVSAVLDREHQMGALSTGDPGFYERLGWERWRGPSYVVGPGGTWTRTPDEDDGIMVRRCAASALVDPTASIACHDRPGDAW